MRQGVRQVALLIAGLGVASTMMLLAFGQYFVRLFLDAGDPNYAEILRLSKSYLNISAFFYIPLGLTWLYNGTLRGAGDTKMPMVSGWVELIFKCGGTILFAHLWGWIGLAFGNPISWVAGLIPVVIAYYRGNWIRYSKKILE